MIACKYETVKPAGEWNQARLIIKDGKTEHWLNGRKVVEYQIDLQLTDMQTNEVVWMGDKKIKKYIKD